MRWFRRSGRADRRERLGGGSLRRRLVASATLFIVASVVVVGLVLNAILDRVVRGEVASRLDLQISTITAELSAPAPLRPRERGERGPPEADEPRPGRLLDGLNAPPFDREGSGWYWQARVDGRVVASSRSLDGAELRIGRGETRRRGGPSRLIEAEGPEGEAIVARLARLPVGGREAVIVATAPREAILRPVRAATASVALALLVLGAALVLAILLQVRYGLKPLETLRRDLNAVRAGSRNDVPADQPAEIAPLARELNALIEQDAANLRQARRHVANLAHGLKTPLATLSAAAERMEASAVRTEFLALTGLMDRRVRHHLRRAQSAALAGSAHRHADVGAHLGDLCAMLTRFHAGTGTTLSHASPEGLSVAVDGDDLDEMLGNLLDNAMRHARSSVSVRADAAGRFVRIRIADDGPGLGEAEMATARLPGRRLDESEGGHGFGLPITTEIAELYGGRLELARAAEGGLKALLVLPAAIAPEDG